VQEYIVDVVIILILSNTLLAVFIYIVAPRIWQN